MKIWKIGFYILGLIPWSFIILLMTFYFVAWNFLGYRPIYDYPDPGQLYNYVTFAPYIITTGIMWAYSFLVWLPYTIIYLIVDRKEIKWKPVVISTMSQLATIIMYFSGIVEWFMD